MIHLDKIQTSSNPIIQHSACHTPRSPTGILEAKDQILSMKSDDESLTLKYAGAIGIGVAPFAISYAGIFMIQCLSTMSLWVEKNSKGMENNVGRYVSGFFRLGCGIPALIAAGMAFGGAMLFAKSQEVVWGEKLVKHPEEEKINTKLARYGASEHPMKDLKQLINAFFDSNFLTKKEFEPINLKHWANFKVK